MPLSKKTKARALVFVISDISVCDAQKKKRFMSKQYYFKAAFFNFILTKRKDGLIRP